MSKATSAISRRGASRFWLGVATANSPKADGGQSRHGGRGITHIQRGVKR